MSDHPFELGRRTRGLPPPPWVVCGSRCPSRAVRAPARGWSLLDDEVEPRILDEQKAGSRGLVVAVAENPDQLIRFELAPEGDGTGLTVGADLAGRARLERVGHRRFRLNHLLFADLRYSYGQ